MAEPFDWDDIKRRWEAHAEELGKDPRDLTRNEVRRLEGFSNAFNTRPRDRARGALSFRYAKDHLFPPPIPAAVHPTGHRLKGVSTLVGPNGEIRQQWIKTDREKEEREDLLREALAEIPTLVPPKTYASAPAPENAHEDLLSVYPIGDAHVGLLAWHGDAEEDFDLHRARDLLTGAARFLTAQGQDTKEALLINLGDFLHNDSQENRTRRSGHQLDVDSRYAKIVRAGLHAMIAMVNHALAHHEHVTVINEIGNHDDTSAIWLAVALDSHYLNEPRVTVDMSPALFHYYRHGKVLIGCTHGDKAKATDLEGIMAHDQAAVWSETEHRAWYVGHVHHKRVHEFRNCTVEYCRTLTPRDAYAQGHGYRGRRDMQKVVYSAEYGELARYVADFRLVDALNAA